MPLAPQDRRRLGLIREDAVATFLQEQGYLIVERNKTFGKLEIDVIAYDNVQTGILVFIEIRSRTLSAQYDEQSIKYGTAADSVRSRKQQHLVKAAQIYLTRLRQPWPRCRFDVVESLFSENGNLEHCHVIKNAFTASNTVSGW